MEKVGDNDAMMAYIQENNWSKKEENKSVGLDLDEYKIVTRRNATTAKSVVKPTATDKLHMSQLNPLTPCTSILSSHIRVFQ